MKDGKNLYERLIQITGTDIIEVFGESGTCKTTFALEAARDAIKKGVKVLFIDTEKNIVNKPDGVDLVYFPSFIEAYKYILTIPRGYGLVILDSMGLPILGEFANMDMKSRGEVLLKAQSVSYALKKYSNENKAVVIVTNQPVSEFNKGKDAVLTPFGDKSIYFYKEVWSSESLSSTPDRTSCAIKAFRSRTAGRGKRIFKLEVTNAGVEVSEE